MGTEKKIGAQETVATAISGAIVLAIVVYWIVQINGVLEMMKLANG